MNAIHLAAQESPGAGKLKTGSLKKLFSVFDVAVVGEAKTAICGPVAALLSPLKPDMTLTMLRRCGAPEVLGDAETLPNDASGRRYRKRPAAGSRLVTVVATAQQVMLLTLK